MGGLTRGRGLGFMSHSGFHRVISKDVPPIRFFRDLKQVVELRSREGGGDDHFFISGIGAVRRVDIGTSRGRRWIVNAKIGDVDVEGDFTKHRGSGGGHFAEWMGGSG